MIKSSAQPGAAYATIMVTSGAGALTSSNFGDDVTGRAYRPPALAAARPGRHDDHRIR